MNGLEDAVKIGQGFYRDVYEYDAQHVIKIERLQWGASAKEVAMWEKVSSTPMRQFFAAIVDSTPDGWILQERVTRTAKDMHYEDNWTLKEGHFGNSWGNDCSICGPIVRPLQDVADTFGVGDVHVGNIGQRADGSWCIIDYAS